MRLPPGASSIADAIDSLHALIALSTLVVGLVLFVLATRYVFRYRRRSADQTTEHLESSPRTETAVVGFVLVAFIVFWILGFRKSANMPAPPADAETIYVDAKQWMWKFGYMDGRATNDVLTVP